MRPHGIGFLRPAAFLAPVVLIFVSAGAQSQDAAAFFKQNCTSCHTIGGGRLVGPDLKGVTQRQPDRKWLVDFINDPTSKLDAGDPYAAKLLGEARGARMNKVAGINQPIADSLLVLIDAESRLAKSQFAGTQISDRPFTGQDVANGRNIFLGQTRLAAGGAACVSCHSIVGLRSLGGGRLGPDLTKAFERLGGRKGLATWLSAPPTLTMNPVFRNTPLDASTEILPLIAFFQDAAQKGGVADTSTSMFNFLLLGLGGTVVLLILFDLFWLKRFRAVRKPMLLGLDVRGHK